METIFLLGNILKPIASLLGLIMNGIYEFFHLFVKTQNIALSIFVFTFIVKTLMFPLTIKQQKFSRLQSKITPEVQKVQQKYKGKKDEVSLRKQQTETQAVYQKYGASPTSGCLPLLITLPIMFALYSVINNIPDFVNLVRDQYEVVAKAIESAGTGVLTNIVDQPEKLTTIDEIIKALALFTREKWEALSKVGELEPVLATIKNINETINDFFGLSITDRPYWKSISIIIPILSMSLQFLQSKQLTVKTDNKDSAPNPMSSMNVVMPIMSGFFCYMLPIGVGLYWIANSLFSIIQQFFVNKHLDRMDIDELVEKSQEKAKNKMMRKKASLGGTSIQELASKQTKSIESISDRTKESKDNEANDKPDDLDENVDNESDSNRKRSISEIANLLKNKNGEKGD